MSDRSHPSNLLDYRVGANLARGRSPLTLHQRLSLQILANRGQITIATDDSHDCNAAVDGAIEDDVTLEQNSAHTKQQVIVATTDIGKLDQVSTLWSNSAKNCSPASRLCSER